MSATDAIVAIDRLTALHSRNREAIAEFGRKLKTAVRLLTYLESNPIIEIQKTTIALGTTFKTVSDAVKRLCDAKILVQTAGEHRNRIFMKRIWIF
ncbi:MAG: hypothetical protein LBB19_00915 [Puniceicoccales bacterium]|nr:hypothetical protein [Puniceicoccales bacterium]